MSFEIKNKNVLITGATSGIGEATAIDLAKKGANIFFIARNNLKAQNLSDKIEFISGKRSKFFGPILIKLDNIIISLRNHFHHVDSLLMANF